jgi:hypothetical protein
MESVAGPDGSPVHAAPEQRDDNDEDAGDVLHSEAAGVLGGRMPETRPLVKWTAAALAPGVARALAKWRGGRCDGVRDALRQTRRGSRVEVDPGRRTGRAGLSEKPGQGWAWRGAMGGDTKVCNSAAFSKQTKHCDSAAAQQGRQ